MIYVCLPFDRLLDDSGQPRPEKKAAPRETVVYRFDRSNVSFLYDIVRAFGLASRQHAEDLGNILDALTKQ